MRKCWILNRAVGCGTELNCRVSAQIHLRPRFLIPQCGGTIDHHGWREKLWARFYTAAPQRLRRSPGSSPGKLAIQRSEESVRALTRRHGISPTTVQKWRKRTHAADARMGPKAIHSTVLNTEEEAMVVTFRRHTLLPLDDCLYALQASIPHLTRSSLHRCLQRHGISRLPDRTGDKPAKQKFKVYPIGRSATSTSTSPRSVPRKVSSTSMSGSIAPRSSPSSRFMTRLTDRPRSRSWRR